MIPYNGYARPPAMPPLYHLQLQAQMDQDVQRQSKLPPGTSTSPLKPHAATFRPQTRLPLPADFNPQQHPLPSPARSTHQRGDSGVEFNEGREEEDVRIRTIRHRWERTRWKFEFPCLKCTACGDEKKEKKHRMVDCKFVTDYERQKIFADREELLKEIDRLDLDVDRSASNAADHEGFEALRQTVDDIMNMDYFEVAKKVAETVLDTYGEEIWAPPCKRCEVLHPTGWIRLRNSGKIETHDWALTHRLVDCVWVHGGARRLLKMAKGESMTRKERELLGWVGHM